MEAIQPSEGRKRGRPAKKSSLKNKDLTKRRLIDAVGEIVRKEGYKGLGVNKIARQAQTDKKLIYRYFTHPDQLIRAYIEEKDYWISLAREMQEVAASHQGSSLKDYIVSILIRQYEFLDREEELQKLILEEISSQNPLLDSIAQLRDDMGNELLKATDLHFKDSGIRFRAISALLVSAIYYLVLHSKVNNSTFCGLQLNHAEGKASVKEAISAVVSFAFAAAEERQ